MGWGKQGVKRERDESKVREHLGEAARNGRKQLIRDYVLIPMQQNLAGDKLPPI